ncbi:MAG: thrombospondin type 3 repeat-containing protein [Candidatus Paceibacterota bacterium]
MTFFRLFVSIALVFALSLSLGVSGAFAQNDDDQPDTSGPDSQFNEDQPATDQATSTESEEEPDASEDDPLSPIRPADTSSSEEREERRQIIENRSMQSETDRTTDSDGDGLTDYDEINIYGTDPEDPDTSGNGMTDGEMVAAGLDPTSTSTEPITTEDPREVPDESFSEEYVITAIEAVSESDTSGTERTSVRITGQGPANSYVSLFIFSVPVRVTVETDGSGRFEYTYREQLADGNHQAYTATVDNSGRVLARSAGIPFVKEANAITVGDSPSYQPAMLTASDPVGFFVENYILISIFLLLLILCIAVIIVGMKERKGAGIEV